MRVQVVGRNGSNFRSRVHGETDVQDLNRLPSYIYLLEVLGLWFVFERSSLGSLSGLRTLLTVGAAEDIENQFCGDMLVNMLEKFDI